MKNYPTKSVHGVSLEKHCWNGYISSPFLPHSILVVSAGFLIPSLYIAWPQALEIDLFYGGGKKKRPLAMESKGPGQMFCFCPSSCRNLSRANDSQIPGCSSAQWCSQYLCYKMIMSMVAILHNSWD